MWLAWNRRVGLFQGSVSDGEQATGEDGRCGTFTSEDMLCRFLSMERGKTEVLVRLRGRHAWDAAMELSDADGQAVIKVNQCCFQGCKKIRSSWHTNWSEGDEKDQQIQPVVRPSSIPSLRSTEDGREAADMLCRYASLLHSVSRSKYAGQASAALATQT